MESRTQAGRPIHRAAVSQAPATAAGPSSKFYIQQRHVDLESRIPYLKKNGIKRQIISYTIPIGYDASMPANEVKQLLRPQALEPVFRLGSSHDNRRFVVCPGT